MISTYNYLYENIINPLRCGHISIKVGKTTYNDLDQTFIMLNDLDWMFTLNPSFVLLFQSANALDKPSKTNVTVLYPKKASIELNFNVLSSGSCDVSTYIFGEEKSDRPFDAYYRLFETGFRLYNFKGLEKSLLKIKPETVLHISSKDYEHPHFITGDNKTFSCKARIEREN